MNKTRVQRYPHWVTNNLTWSLRRPKRCSFPLQGVPRNNRLPRLHQKISSRSPPYQRGVLPRIGRRDTKCTWRTPKSVRVHQEPAFSILRRNGRRIFIRNLWFRLQRPKKESTVIWFVSGRKLRNSFGNMPSPTGQTSHPRELLTCVSAYTADPPLPTKEKGASETTVTRDYPVPKDTPSKLSGSDRNKDQTPYSKDRARPALRDLIRHGHSVDRRRNSSRRRLRKHREESADCKKGVSHQSRKDHDRSTDHSRLGKYGPTRHSPARSRNYLKSHSRKRHNEPPQETETKRHKPPRSHQYCPAKGCAESSKYLRDHVYNTHIPALYRRLEWRQRNIANVYRQRLNGLNQLAISILGDSATVGDLVVYINGRIQEVITDQTSIWGFLQGDMRALSRFAQRNFRFTLG